MNELVLDQEYARGELGSQSYDQFTQKEGQPNANIGIFQLPGANAMDVVSDVRAAMQRLSRTFPQGMEYTLPLDTTEFIKQSVHEVYKTLIEAGVLVLIVILVFLQDWRAILIPATTVPVTIIGAFAAMAALGFTVNMLTLFGVVLAIGIVVDDAIVIVENAAHHIERGMRPKQATIRAMSEVLGPIIGITLVLMAVFVPAAFLGGITGQFYRQFALTIAATAFISAINAVTLKPAQCALWLRPPSGRKNWFFRAFNVVYGLIERAYTAIIRRLVRHVFVVMLLFIGLAAGAGWLYNALPTGLLPNEDMGYAMVSVQLPDAASQQRTREVMSRIDEILARTPGVNDWFTIGGLSIMDQSSAPNMGTLFVIFDEWSERLDRGLTQEVLIGRLFGEFSQIQEALVFAFAPPAVRGLGFRGGFQMQIEDRAGAGLQDLQQATQEVVQAAMGQSGLASMNTTFRPGVPQLFVDIDREKVKTLNMSLNSVFGTLQAYLGSAYVNDFNRFGRTYQVRVQADQAFRADPKDIERLEVRNRDGQMVPLGTVATVRKSFGPQIINRYNLYPAASVTGEAAPGRSSGEALRLMEELADRTLPESMDYEWTSMAYQEKQIGGEGTMVFGMAVLLIYLVLAAQYESWFLPMAVILVVPMGLLGSVGAVALQGMVNNIYTQVGIVLIIALASKNAILIVEFARDLHNQGRGVLDAAVEAARLRFRPIIMTSFAFILGVVPLVIAEGAGAAGQRALGTAVLGGMIAATVLAVFFVPTFYVIFQRMNDRFTRRKRETEALEASTSKPAQPSGDGNGRNGDDVRASTADRSV